METVQATFLCCADECNDTAHTDPSIRESRLETLVTMCDATVPLTAEDEDFPCAVTVMVLVGMMCDCFNVALPLLRLHDKHIVDLSALAAEMRQWKEDTTAMYLHAEFLPNTDDAKSHYTQAMLYELRRQKKQLVREKLFVLGGSESVITKAVKKALPVMHRMVACSHRIVMAMYSPECIDNTFECFHAKQWSDLADAVGGGDLADAVVDHANSEMKRLVALNKQFCREMQIEFREGLFTYLKDKVVANFKREVRNGSFISKIDDFIYKMWQQTYLKERVRRPELEVLREQMCFLGTANRSSCDVDRALEDVSRVWKSGKGKQVSVAHFIDVVPIRQFSPTCISEIATSTDTAAGPVFQPTPLAIELADCWLDNFGACVGTHVGKKGTSRSKEGKDGVTRMKLSKQQLFAIKKARQRYKRVGRGSAGSVLVNDDGTPVKLKSLRVSDDVAAEGMAPAQKKTCGRD